MTDDVTLPGTGKIVATEELAGGRHAQIVMAGAKPTQLVAMLTPATGGGYSAGEVMGDQVLIPDVPTGIYVVRSLSVLSLAGADVPKVFVAAYGNVVDSTPPVLDGDGDMWAFDPAGAQGNLTGFASAGDAWAWSGLTAATGPLRSAIPVVPYAPTTISDGVGGTLADLSIVAVTLENTAVDLTGGIIVAAQLERVAALADQTSYTSF